MDGALWARLHAVNDAAAAPSTARATLLPSSYRKEAHFGRGRAVSLLGLVMAEACATRTHRRRANPAPAGFEDTWSVLIVPPPHLGAILAPSKMGAPSNTFQQKLDHVLVATDFSEASKGAVLYATSIARRNQSKLFVAHVVTSASESALMDGWRAGQTVITDNLIANRLDGIESELIVRQGEIWPVLAQLVTEKEIDLLVLGTRGRTGLRKLILGSVAERIFREASCPVLTVGPGVTAEEPEGPPRRILAATGFAPHSIFAVKYAATLAQHLDSSLAVVNVVTGDDDFSATKEAVRKEHLSRLRTVIPSEQSLRSQPALFVEFGSVPERILGIAREWKADLIVLGLHRVEEASKREMTWAKAYEIVRQAKCPVLTVRRPP